MVPVHHRSSFDHLWLASTVSTFQTFLLQSYRWVLFAECDEFVFPTPRQGIEPETLLQFIAGLNTNMPPAVRAMGFEVVQQMDDQPLPPELYKDGNNVELTAGRMVEGCHLWYRSRKYSKTLLANVPAKWRIGFHTIGGAANSIGNDAPSPSLTLVHLHKVDFALALTRSRRSRARQWSTSDIEKQWGWQNRIEHEDELRSFWQQDVDTGEPMQSGRLKPIPPHIKDALR
jgi:hypothetical protein